MYNVMYDDILGCKSYYLVHKVKYHNLLYLSRGTPTQVRIHMKMICANQI